ncbi:hypothetical protein GCM10022223_24130 [Kineosporia mesophila]|uniref:Uncharacterized protein n=1 Tax=Kineosporia mesophila TaxID=566012 RepID=A0ABP6ZHM5_9ACTN|nr:hypothetical protein [Kineosporia mesophila]MCD5354246.1 hypothetical protein [Kineosporia mesophila]
MTNFPVQEEEHPIVAQLRSATLKTLSTIVVPTGVVPPPTLHMFMEDMDQPYAGYVSTRPFYRGEDAARAIARLGQLPATMMASRILLTWEAEDMMLALNSKTRVPSSLDTVEATFTGHVLHRHPLDYQFLGNQVRSVHWRPTERFVNASLPEPIEAALDWWRQLDTSSKIEETVHRLEMDGYGITFVKQ